jgi:type II secretory pathway pseudopilin PulG
MQLFRSTGPARDEGTTMIEVLVAAILMAVAAAAIGTVLLAAVKTSTNDRQRVAASNLAQREIENARNLFGTSDAAAIALGASGTVTNPTPYPSGSVGADSVVDGSTYRVVRTAKWLPTGTGSNACDGGSAVTYPSLQVDVSVSALSGRNIKPLSETTLLTPQKTLLATTTEAYIAVKVLNAAGTAGSGVNVTVSGPSSTAPQTTDSTGCAVFMVTQAGSYTVSLSNTGYVDNNGAATPSKVQVVANGQLYVLPFSYDKAAAIRIVQTILSSTYPAPGTLPAYVAYGNSALPGVTHSVVTPAGSGFTYTTVPNLWPSTDGYTAWSGGCADADPGTVAAGRGTPTVVAPGGLSDVNAQLAPVNITVRNAAGTAKPGVTVTVNSTSTCPSGQSSIVLGSTDSTGHLLVSIPFGSWIATAPLATISPTLIPTSRTTATTATVRVP